MSKYSVSKITTVRIKILIEISIQISWSVVGEWRKHSWKMTDQIVEIEKRRYLFAVVAG